VPALITSPLLSSASAIVESAPRHVRQSCDTACVCAPRSISVVLRF
jgi:hypothetical protein